MTNRPDVQRHLDAMDQRLQEIERELDSAEPEPEPERPPAPVHALPTAHAGSVAWRSAAGASQRWRKSKREEKGEEPTVDLVGPREHRSPSDLH